MNGAARMLVRAVGGFDRWVRDPVDPRPLGWFRCWIGVLSLVNLLLLWPDMPMWLGDDGVLPPGVHRPPLAGPAATVYAIASGTAAIWLIRALGIAGGLGLCLEDSRGKRGSPWSGHRRFQHGTGGVSRQIRREKRLGQARHSGKVAG